MSEGTAWGLLNAGIALNTGIIGGRMLIRAATERHNAGARILYGGMFLSVAVFFTIMAIAQWWLDDGRPQSGLVGLLLLWASTQLAVLYLLVWGRKRGREGIA